MMSLVQGSGGGRDCQADVAEARWEDVGVLVRVGRKRARRGLKKNWEEIVHGLGGLCAAEEQV